MTKSENGSNIYSQNLHFRGAECGLYAIILPLLWTMIFGFVQKNPSLVRGRKTNLDFESLESILVSNEKVLEYAVKTNNSVLYSHYQKLDERDNKYYLRRTYMFKLGILLLVYTFLPSTILENLGAFVTWLPTWIFRLSLSAISVFIIFRSVRLSEMMGFWRVQDEDLRKKIAK